jgi:hypothetical protein
MSTVRDRLVYETPIYLYGEDGLQQAVAKAVAKVARHWEDLPLGFAFRVDDVSYSVAIDPDRDEYGTNTQLEIAAFPVLRVTPKGFHISVGGWSGNPQTRWIGNEWTKQWACRTPEAALRSFIARRKRMAAIYEGRAQSARYWADKAEYLLQKTEHPLLGTEP